MQTSLHKWIKVKNIQINQTKINPIFYLKWSKK